METRRNFIKSMAGITAGMMLPIGWGCKNPTKLSDQLGPLLPMRKLGTTGESVSMLGLGGFHVGWTTEKDALEVIEKAIEGGIRFFDTAHNYGKGMSEERYGKYLVPKYRDHIFLMTKSQAYDGESLLKEVDLSLKRLKTDHIDLLQIHALQNPEDVDRRIGEGVIDAVKSIKESGKARYVGFTGHQNPYAHLRMMEQMPDSLFSTTQMPISLIDYNSEHSFVKKVVPVALENNLGLLAMKTLADGRAFARKQMNEKLRWETETPAIPDIISIKNALYFAWSLPISVLITGAENTVYLEEKIQLAKDFVQLSEDEREKIIESASAIPNIDKIEYYKKIEA